MKASQIKRLEKLEKAAKVGVVDIATAILEARANFRAGIKRPPLTAEQTDQMQRSPLGRAILAARRRVGLT